MYRRPPLSRAAAVLVTATGLVVLAGCGSGSGPIKPAPDAQVAACTQLIGNLPVQVLSRSRNTLPVTGAASWGKPAIVLRCGVTPPGPTTDLCVEADGLDWVFTETKQTLRFVTFGRNPGVEVTVPVSVGRETATGALVDLAQAVRPVKTTAHCT